MRYVVAFILGAWLMSGAGQLGMLIAEALVVSGVVCGVFILMRPTRAVTRVERRRSATVTAGPRHRPTIH